MKKLLLSIVCVIIVYNLAFAEVANLYPQTDMQTVNGQTAYRLGTAYGSSYAYIYDAKGQGTYGVSYESDISILHSDGSETPLATNVATVTQETWQLPNDLRSSVWSCPPTSLVSTDALKIVSRVWVRNWIRENSPASTTFITRQLGWTKLNAATWTFYYHTARSYVVGLNYTDIIGKLYWGNSTYATKIEGIDYSTYVDSGLRIYDGTAIRVIACEPEGKPLTSPLRIRKGSTTYGIVLDDPNASNTLKIRVKTNSGIKALVGLN